MNRTYLGTVILMVLLGTSASLLNAKTGETTNNITSNSITSDSATANSIVRSPCVKAAGRFQLKSRRKGNTITAATRSLVRYSKVIVLESLTITKDSIHMAFDLAIESL